MANKPWELTQEQIDKLLVENSGVHPRKEMPNIIAHAAQKKLLEYLYVSRFRRGFNTS
jgi:hypothetical protein